MTSYGERVEKVVPFTILSILKQSIQPESILLWLDDIHRNEHNVPQKLIDLQDMGLSIAFCKDIRSYKKLIPTMLSYKDKIIVTIDDDIYYSSNFLEEIYNTHLQFPDCIITENFCYPTFTNGALNSYKQWKEYHYLSDDRSLSQMLIFPQGFGGVLYPINSLPIQTIEERQFMKFAPHADDIWFYIMGILKGTKKKCVINSKTKYYFLDLFRQIKTRDRLHDVNVGEHQNDKQLADLITEYNINLKDYE